MRVIAGNLRGKKLHAAPAEITRPTSDRAKEGLFNILNHLLLSAQKKWEDIIFCDVFAGSGAIGIEAVSRGTKHVFFFENNPQAFQFLKKNTTDLYGSLLQKDACFPPSTKQPADIVFMDPPYGEGLWEKALVAFYRAGWVDENTFIIVESDKIIPTEIPAPFILQQERFYSRNKFLFLKLDSVDDAKNR